MSVVLQAVLSSRPLGQVVLADRTWAILTLCFLVLLPFVSAQQTSTTSVANDTSTGTSINKTACLTNIGKAITCGASTTGAIGIVQAGNGISGNATVAVSGTVNCAFDGSTTAGHFVVTSATAGECKDTSTYPTTAGTFLGRVLGTNSGAGTYAMVLTPTGAGNWMSGLIPSTGWASSTATDAFVSGLNQPATSFRMPNQSYSGVLGVTDVPVISSTCTNSPPPPTPCNNYGAAGVVGLARSGYPLTGGEGGRFEGRIDSAKASAWGVSALAESCDTSCAVSGTPYAPNLLIGGEFDVDAYAAASAQVTGVFVVSKSTTAPTTSYFDGVLVRDDTAGCTPSCIPFNYAFHSDVGAAKVALFAAPLASTSSNSQAIQLDSYDGTTTHNAQILADINGGLVVQANTSGAATVQNSLTVQYGGPIPTTVASIDSVGNVVASGSGSFGLTSSPCGTTLGCIGVSEGSAPTAGTAAEDVCYGGSVLHGVKCSYNSGSFLPVPLLTGTLNSGGLAFLDATTGNYLDLSGDWTISGHTLTAGSAGALNLAAAPTAAGFVAPQSSGCSPNEGAECYDTGQQTYIGTDHTSTKGSFPRLVYSAFNYNSGSSTWTDVLCALAGDTITNFPCNNGSTSLTTETSFKTGWGVPANWGIAGKRISVKLQFATTTSSSPPVLQIAMRWGGTANSSSPGGTVIYKSSPTTILTASMTDAGFDGTCTAAFVTTTSLFSTCDLFVPGWTLSSTRNAAGSLPIGSLPVSGTETLVITALMSAATAGNALALAGIEIFAEN